ncbi:GNAT family N-acetyltransferase [Frigidibacter sp. RF13]|uniref:GNAT family N-acetyltransferase n=1 Tax=Frigidibacter sp. RF13 TaxID=2997340 RepID=UPI002270B26A|nr:GNAT family N-acetyltransferase [Frigidibacter sp. RF13]MCY1125971.1 GNAT family N-acetyltransferase [Frigidibacter sp. RF13]
MTLTIRPYRPEDRAAAAHIFYRAVREGAADHYDADQRAAWAPSPEPDYASPSKLERQWCWIAERDGAPVGFMSLERDGYLDMAFVLPEEMGRGTARALYAALIERARAEGLRRLWVTGSHLARRFFLARDWRVVWMENLHADGQVYQVFRMVVDLDGPNDD